MYKNEELKLCINNKVYLNDNEEINKKHLKKNSNSLYSIISENDKKLVELKNKDLDLNLKKIFNKEWFILIWDKVKSSNISEIEFIYYNIIKKYNNKIRVYFSTINKNNQIKKKFLCNKPLISIMKNYEEKYEFELKRVLYNHYEIDEFLKIITNGIKTKKNKDNKIQSIYTFGLNDTNKKIESSNKTILLNLYPFIEFYNILSDIKDINLKNKLKYIWLKGDKIKKLYIKLNIKHFYFLRNNYLKLEVYIDTFFDKDISEINLKEFIIKNYLKLLLKNDNQYETVQKILKNGCINWDEILNNFIYNNNEKYLVYQIINIINYDNIEKSKIDGSQKILSLKNINNNNNFYKHLPNTDKNKKQSKFHLNHKNSNSIESLKLDSNNEINENKNFRKNKYNINKNIIKEIENMDIKEIQTNNENENFIKINNVEMDRKYTNGTARFNDESDNAEQNKNNTEVTNFNNINNNNKINNKNIDNFNNINNENILNNTNTKTKYIKTNNNINLNELDINKNNYFGSRNNFNSDNELKSLLEIKLKNNEKNVNIEELNMMMDNVIKEDIYENSIENNELYDTSNNNKSLNRAISAINVNTNLKEELISHSDISIISNNKKKKRCSNLKINTNHKIKQIKNNDNSIIIDSSIKINLYPSTKNIINRNLMTNFYKIRSMHYNNIRDKVSNILISNKMSYKNKDILYMNIHSETINLNDLIYEYDELKNLNLKKTEIKKKINYFFICNKNNLKVKDFIKELNIFNDYSFIINKYKLFFNFIYENINLINQKTYLWIYELFLNDNITILSFFEILLCTTDLEDFFENIKLLEKNSNYDNHKNLNIMKILKEISVKILNTMKIYLDNDCYDAIKELINNNNIKIIKFLINYLENDINYSRLINKIKKFSKNHLLLSNNFNSLVHSNIENFNSYKLEDYEVNFMKFIKNEFNNKIYYFILNYLDKCNPFINGLIEYFNVICDKKHVYHSLNLFLKYKNLELMNFKIESKKNIDYENYLKNNYNYEGEISFELKILIREILYSKNQNKKKILEQEILNKFENFN